MRVGAAEEHPGASADERARALEAAARLFAERGFWEVSVSEIDRAAGLPKGTFAAHFPSKIDALNAALREYLQALERALGDLAALPFRPDRWRADFVKAIGRLLEFISSHRTHATLAFREEGLREGWFPDAITVVRGRLGDLVRQKLGPLQREGIIAPVDLDLVAVALYGAVNDTVRHVVLRGAAPPGGALPQALADLLLDGICARPPDPGKPVGSP